MRKLLFLSLLVLTTSIGCPSKKDPLSGHVNPEELKTGSLNPELEKALNEVLSEKDSAAVKTAPCPESLSEDKDKNLTKHFECGAIRVPDYHDKTSAGFQSLAFLIVQKDKSRKKPLLVIEQGGPGMSSMTLASYYLNAIPELINDFDILAVEQRGTSWTRPEIACKEITKYKLSTLNGNESEAEISRLKRQCLDRVSKMIQLDSISTYQIASDLVYSAKYFGYNKFSYFGVSYGTLVGQYLLRFHPGSLEKTILDSPVVPGMDWTGDAMLNMDNVVRKNLEDYKLKNSDWSRTPEESVTHLNRLANSYDALPLSLNYKYEGKNYGYLFKGEDFLNILVQLLTSSYNPDHLSALLLTAEKRALAPTGTSNLMELIVQAYASVDGDESTLMYQSIICREFEIESVDYADVLSNWTLLPDLVGDKEELASSVEKDTRCDLGFQKAPDSKVLTQPVSTDKSVLVVGGETDHVTSADYVAVVAKDFSNGHQAVFEGVGHGTLGAKPCINKSVVEYLKDSTGRFRNYCD